MDVNALIVHVKDVDRHLFFDKVKFLGIRNF